MAEELRDRYRLFGVAVVAYLLYRVGAPLITFLGDGFLQVALSTLVFMALATWVVMRAAALPLRPAVALGGMALALLLFFVVRLSPAFVPALRQSPVALEVALGVSDTLMVLAASMLGLAVSHIVREPNILAPAALFAALVDFAVVSLWIPRVMQAVPYALSTVAVHVPQVGAKPTPTGLRPIGIIGPADFVFLAFYFACVWRFNMAARATYLWMVIALAGYMVFQNVVGSLTPRFMDAVDMLPGLVPMAVVLIIVNRRYFRFSREEKRAMAVVALLVAGILAFAFWSLK
ncbi:MAG: hypothetical protein RMM08_05375 [Armatimonadota bacterium]|nr:hypothetical protein [bacterium]MDW8320772.1 hypothetical protein [Armatimonadota bacterium]